MGFLNAAPKAVKKILIITSSGGGGLLQAANAKEQEARSCYPDAEIVRRDVLKDWMGEVFGNFCLKKWNFAQISGDVAALRFLIASQYFFDYFCWPYLFLCALFTFFKEDMDHVIDTQPIGTSAILKALRIYNYQRKKQVFLQKILVDLPTKAATHFFRPIRRLTKKDRPYLQLTTIAPLLEEGQTPEMFWQANCRLSEKQIQYEDVCVRQAFRKFQHRPRVSEPFSLRIRFQSDDELQWIQRTSSRGKLSPCLEGAKEISFLLPPEMRLITILLGSQPASEATFNYVKEFIRIAAEADCFKDPSCLFVFCSDHAPGQDSLFRKIGDYVEQLENYPASLTIVPFSFQSDDVIAPLFYRSHATCTRSGGQTSMELMCVSSGEIWIHSEAMGKKPTLLQLLDGIPGWEAANALYLKKVRGAKIITPETVSGHVERLFGTTAQTEHSSAQLVSMA